MDKRSNIAIGTFDGFDIAYRQGTSDETVVTEHSFDKDIFFAGVPEYQPKDDDIIIDIGAHIGTFTVLAASKVKSGKVYAIEASEDTFNLLRINVALNRCSNASVHHAAISDKNGTIMLHHDVGNWGHSTVKKLSEFNETVVSVTLPAFMEQNGIDRCHFMKLNCEGGEFPILLSTPHDVLRRFGTILVLYHCDLWKENTEEDLMSHLQAAGFRCEIRNRHKSRGWIIAV
jgi:FkbM family methyltransferase